MLSKIAYWLVWTALTAVVLVLVYRNTDWFKPAADKAVDSVKSVVAKVPTGPFGKDTTNDKADQRSRGVCSWRCRRCSGIL